MRETQAVCGVVMVVCGMLDMAPVVCWSGVAVLGAWLAQEVMFEVSQE